MAKYAIITDTHAGARNDSPYFDRLSRQFFTREFFPGIQEHNVDGVLHLGDVFDRRKYINFNILNSTRQYFFDPLAELGLPMLVIPGNHDTYYKNTNDLNSLKLLISGYENIKVLYEPSIVKLSESEKALFVPWMCEDNTASCLKAIRKKATPWCFGHFEIEGFEMYKGIPNEGGLKQSLFKHYDLVASGHFHHRSTNGNISYMGSPYEMTWADFEDPRGYHIFDTETGEATFIENPHTMHRRIYYDDSAADALDPTQYVDKCVKLVVVEKNDVAKYEGFLEALYSHPPAEVQILEDYSDITQAADDENIEVEDTATMLEKCVDATITTLDKTRIKTLMRTLFIEAQHREKNIDD